ncbi:hypothetical protein CVT25_015838, partial [Psilocybe cyanescens]
ILFWGKLDRYISSSNPIKGFSSSSSHSSHQPQDPPQPQHADYTPNLQQQQAQLRSPGTPMHLEDSRLLAGFASQPSSPIPAPPVQAVRSASLRPQFIHSLARSRYCHVPSRPVFRRSITPFPARNINNPSSSSSPRQGGSPMRFTPAAADEGVLATLCLGPNSSGFPSAMGTKGAGAVPAR